MVPKSCSRGKMKLICCQGKKCIHRQPDPDVTEQKKLWHIPYPWESKGKMGYTIGLERRVYTIEASDPEKAKKEGFHGGGVYFFLPCVGRRRGIPIKCHRNPH